MYGASPAFFLDVKISELWANLFMNRPLSLCVIKDVITHKTTRPERGEMAKELRAIGKKIDLALPALFAPDAKTAERIIEFFTAQIRNGNTRMRRFSSEPRGPHPRLGRRRLALATVA